MGDFICIFCSGYGDSTDSYYTKILQPIESAMDVFAKIKETQDYSLRIPVKSKDEMGQLSQSINELLAYTEKEKCMKNGTG